MRIYVLSIIHSNSHVQGVDFLQAPSCKSVIRHLWSKQTTSWNLVLEYIVTCTLQEISLGGLGKSRNPVPLLLFPLSLMCTHTPVMIHTLLPMTTDIIIPFPTHTPSLLSLEAHFSAMPILSLWFIHYSEQFSFSTAFLDLTTGLIILRSTGPFLPDNFIIAQSIFISQWMDLTHVTAARNQK